MTTGATVPTSNKFPAVFTQVTFGASPNLAGSNPRTVLLLANKASTGSAVADTEVVGPLTSAIALAKFGAHSELYLAFRAIAKHPLAALAKVYAIAVTAATGVQASATITVANAATGSGDLKITIHGIVTKVPVVTGQSAATIGANITAALNANPDLCVASAHAAGPPVVETISFTHNGTRGNLVKVYCEPDTTITGTTFTLSAAALTGGTGTDTLTAALVTMGASTYDLVACANTDTTALQAVQTKLLANAAATVRKREQALYTSEEVIATATTQVETLNECRMQGLWHSYGEDLTIVPAAVFAAIRSVQEQINPNVNLSLMNPSVVDLYPSVQPPHSPANYMTETDAAAALDVGLSPIWIRPSDAHPIVALSITTHSNDSGGNPDTRTLTTNMVTTPDAWARAVEVFVPSAFVGTFLVPDPVEGDDPQPPNTVSPLVIKGSLIDLYVRTFGDKGYVKSVAADTASWSFAINSSNENRCDADMGIHPSPWFTQFSGSILQLSGTS